MFSKEDRAYYEKVSLINRALRHATSVSGNYALRNKSEIGISNLHVNCFSVIFKLNWVGLERKTHLFWLSTLQTWPEARTDCPGLSMLWLYKPDSASRSHYAAMSLSGIKPHFQVHLLSLPPSVGIDRNQAKKSITPCRLVISLGDCAQATNEFKSLSHSNNSTRSRSVQACLSLTKLSYDDKSLSMACLCSASQKNCLSLNEAVELETI